MQAKPPEEAVGQSRGSSARRHADSSRSTSPGPDELIVEAYQVNASMTAKQVGGRFGVSRYAVLACVRAAGVKPHPRGRHKDPSISDETVVALYSRLQSIHKVALVLGRSYTMVRSRLIKLDVKFRRRGEYRRHQDA